MPIDYLEIKVGVINNVAIAVSGIPHLCKFEEIDDVGFTTVYDEEDALVLRKMIPYIQSANADIYCVHVNKVKETKTHEEIARWKERFKQDTVYFIEKNQDDIVKAVFNFIDQYSIDMLAVLLETSPFFNVLLKAALLKNYPTINGFLY